MPCRGRQMRVRVISKGRKAKIRKAVNERSLCAEPRMACRGCQMPVNVIMMLKIWTVLPLIHIMNAIMPICFRGDPATSHAFCGGGATMSAGQDDVSRSRICDWGPRWRQESNVVIILIRRICWNAVVKATSMLAFGPTMRTDLGWSSIQHAQSTSGLK